MPEDLVGDGAWLVLQLFHHRLHSQQVLLLRPLLIHAGDEMACADVVEVIVQDVVAANVTFSINHRVGVLLAVAAYVLAAIFKIGVEHAFQFNAHDIRPFGFRREVEHIRLWRTFHL